MFLSLHGLDERENRLLDIGFASGRFPFSNIPYGIRPRNEVEKAGWSALKGLVFQEATEIFLRFLRGDVFSAKDVTQKVLRRSLFRTDEDWARVVEAYRKEGGANATDEIPIAPFWVFDDVGVIPFEAPMHLLKLTIGAHDAASQDFANKFLPVGVFNLSITPGSVIEQTHERMKRTFNKEGGAWSRSHMPRTVLVFIDESTGVPAEARRARAKAAAEKALSNYWKAVEGTLDPAKIAQAVDNALVGTKEDIIEQMRSRFHKDDRLMLWFDFNNHDNEWVKSSMRWFMERVAPEMEGL
jgi:hypothetical protein